MMPRITFDSNVWRPVVSPARFKKEPNLPAFTSINRALQRGQARGFLCETIFTNEAIPRTGRREFFTKYQMSSDATFADLPNDTIKIGLSVGPDKFIQPTNTDYLSKHLEDAIVLGLKIMRIPRIGSFSNPDLHESWFDEHPQGNSSSYANTCGRLAREIEARGCGLEVLKSIGRRYGEGLSWHEGVRKAPSSEGSNIAKAFAEWADADSVIAHIASGNHFFCTKDRGKSAGNASVLAPTNRSWLEQEYGIKFVEPHELAKVLMRYWPMWLICKSIRTTFRFFAST